MAKRFLTTILMPDGSSGDLAIGFLSDSTTGLYWDGTALHLQIAGTDEFALNNDDLTLGVDVLAPDGSESSPVYSYSSNTDTGSYLTADEQIAFTIDAEDVMFIKSTGSGNPIESGVWIDSHLAVGPDAERDKINGTLFNDVILSLEDTFTHTSSSAFGQGTYIDFSPSSAGTGKVYGSWIEIVTGGSSSTGVVSHVGQEIRVTNSNTGTGTAPGLYGTIISATDASTTNTSGGFVRGALITGNTTGRGANSSHNTTGATVGASYTAGYNTADVKGITNTATIASTSAITIDEVTGIESVTTAGNAAHTVTLMQGIESTLSTNSQAGMTITDAYGVRVNTDTFSSTATNAYGIYIDDFSAIGTTDYNLYSAGAGTTNYLEGDLDVDGHMALGADATINTDRILFVDEEFTHSSGQRFGIWNSIDLAPSSSGNSTTWAYYSPVDFTGSNDSTGTIRGGQVVLTDSSTATSGPDMRGWETQVNMTSSSHTVDDGELYGGIFTVTKTGQGFNSTNGLYGVTGTASFAGANNVGDVLGGLFTAAVSSSSGTPDVSELTGIRVNSNWNSTAATTSEHHGVDIKMGSTASAGTVTSSYFFRARGSSGGGFNTASTNLYGVYIDDLSTYGTTSYNFYSAGSTAQHYIEGDLDVDGQVDIGEELSVGDGVTPGSGFSSLPVDSKIIARADNPAYGDDTGMATIIGVASLSNTGTQTDSVMGLIGEVTLGSSDTATHTSSNPYQGPMMGVYGGVTYGGEGSLEDAQAGVFRVTYGQAGNGTLTNAWGVRSRIEVGETSATLTSAVGVESYLESDTANGTTITTAEMYRSHYDASFNSTITNLYGFRHDLDGGGSTITNAYGFYVDTPAGSAVTNNYGVYVTDQSGVGSTNAFNIYSAGSGSSNFFEGHSAFGPDSAVDDISSTLNTVTTGRAIAIFEEEVTNDTDSEAEYGIMSYLEADPATAVTGKQYVGTSGYVETPSSNTVNYGGSSIAGGAFSASHAGDGDFSGFAGAIGLSAGAAIASTSAGAVPLFIGAIISTDSQGSGTVSTQAGAIISTAVDTAQTVTNAVGLSISAPTGTGTPTTAAGINIEDWDGFGTTSLNLYSKGSSSENLFEGNVDIDGELTVGDATFIEDATLEVQTTTSTAAPAIVIDQNDTDEPFINFEGTSGANTTDSISTHGTAGTIQGWIQIEINGTKRWIPFYDDPSA